MKKIIKYSFYSLLLVLVVFSACKEDDFFAIPTQEVDSFDPTGKDLITIAEFKSRAAASPSVTLIEDDVYLPCVVIANDVSGNIYKEIYVQDETGGLKIPIDAKGLYNQFPVGKKLYIRCKGMYVGNSYEIIQLSSGMYDGKPGRVVSDRLDTIFYKDGAPSLSNVDTINLADFGINGAAEIPKTYMSQLIKVTNVSFEQPGETYGIKSTSYPERNIVDASGNVNVLSLSNYATFAWDTMPAGVGEITAILSDYQGNRLKIRDINDVYMYNLLMSESFVSNPNWDTKDISGDGAWVYNAGEGYMEINGWKSTTGEGNEDYLVSESFDLSSSEAPILSFSSRRRYEDSGESEPMSLWITDSYTGDATTTTWTKLDANFDMNTTTSISNWYSSGNVDLSSYSGSDMRIAFLFKSSGDGSGTASRWEIDNINIIDN